MNTVKFGKYEYRPIGEQELPRGDLYFSTPRHMQGQAVEWSFADRPGDIQEGWPGDKYARRQFGPEVTYFRLMK